ncbi:hypothetical protein KO561_15340 [Radiobacillus kanasensis]|uniref:ComF family protein n=1 Tax=Radiobacillus kanasensis TaxID=2844358 RepID=UPI001E403181|nr:phosphoribosyltransferase family protein [Radiobacillus kanasensis]UFT98557.1 hypothetical protein KO561_15340 [Radiobacillus kanasensis]
MRAFESEWKTQFNQTFDQIKDLTVLPIPLSEERLLERKFNQSDALITLLPVTTQRVLKRINSEKQSKKSRQERMTMKNPFQLMTPIHTPVLLVDDIYTTGSTLRHAARLLKESGCPKVYAMTLAR